MRALPRFARCDGELGTGPTRTELRPELVPGVEVLEALRAGRDPAVLDLEDEAQSTSRRLPFPYSIGDAERPLEVRPMRIACCGVLPLDDRDPAQHVRAAQGAPRAFAEAASEVASY